MSRDRKYYCVYIIGSLSGTLYIGVTGNLHRRLFQHKFHHFEGFTERYDVTRLLYWESYDEVHKALARKTQLKGWTRAKKIALIVRRNPQWLDLASEWYPWMKSEQGRDASTTVELRQAGAQSSLSMTDEKSNGLDRRLQTQSSDS
jgi:putative endonuclease